MPPAVRSKLEREVEKELNIVNANMKNKAVEIFRETHLQLFRTFTFEDESSELSEARGDKSKEACAEANPPEVSDPRDIFEEADFAPMLDEEFWLSLIPSSEASVSQPHVSDSAYGTMPANFSSTGTEKTL